MKIEPAFDDFAPAYDRGEPQVIWTSLVADVETPVSAYLKLARGKKNSFVLESVEGGAVRGRYSFIGLEPDLVWRCHGNVAEINRDVLTDPAGFAPCPVAEADGAIASLRSLVAESRIDLPEGLPPMSAGLVGYASYDTVRLVEDIPDNNPDVLGIPDGIFLRPTVMAVFDTIKDVINVFTPIWPKDGVDAQSAYGAAVERLKRIVADFDTPLPEAARAHPERDVPDLTPSSNMTQGEFHEMVEKGKEYIKAGDVFQVVLSQRFSVPFPYPPFALYRSLRRLNPSPFLFFLDFEDFAIVGSSPEILVRVREGKVTIRPIAGTRKRGKDAAEDQELAQDLLSDPKELAEHLMLLDLGRNDVGRVAKTGTVTVTEQFTIENYSHVMHIVSNVEGELNPDLDALDALYAGFPAGTVSGAPKVRAMEIIDELEKHRRGVYAGCIGYFGADGDMDSCIALRTAVVKDDVMYVQAGGGVVHDSSPEGEYQESINKSRALVSAAAEAVKFAG
ncbi:MAG: anthranilate synthase component I [Rhodospirillaceae bacterium]|nr:anthranilate synthase component I [Rhodospirillaceae bacterium]